MNTLNANIAESFRAIESAYELAKQKGQSTHGDQLDLDIEVGGKQVTGTLTRGEDSDGTVEFELHLVDASVTLSRNEITESRGPDMSAPLQPSEALKIVNSVAKALRESK